MLNFSQIGEMKWPGKVRILGTIAPKSLAARPKFAQHGGHRQSGFIRTKRLQLSA